MKKLLSNILFVTILSVGLKPQPIEATILSKLAIAAATIGTTVFGFKHREVACPQDKSAIKQYPLQERQGK